MVLYLCKNIIYGIIFVQKHNIWYYIWTVIKPDNWHIKSNKLFVQKYLASFKRNGGLTTKYFVVVIIELIDIRKEKIKRHLSTYLIVIIFRSYKLSCLSYEIQMKNKNKKYRKIENSLKQRQKERKNVVGLMVFSRFSHFWFLEYR